MTHVCSIYHFITVSTSIIRTHKHTHTHKCTSSSHSLSPLWSGLLAVGGRYCPAIGWRDRLLYCCTHTENVKYFQVAGCQIAHCGNAVRMGSVTRLSLRNLSHVHRSHFCVGGGERERGIVSWSLNSTHAHTTLRPTYTYIDSEPVNSKLRESFNRATPG